MRTARGWESCSPWLCPASSADCRAASTGCHGASAGCHGASAGCSTSKHVFHTIKARNSCVGLRPGNSGRECRGDTAVWCSLPFSCLGGGLFSHCAIILVTFLAKLEGTFMSKLILDTTLLFQSVLPVYQYFRWTTSLDQYLQVLLSPVVSTSSY